MRLLGIGSGLFFLFCLWTITILVLLLTARARPPYTSLGPVVLLISTSVTTLLMVIPRSPFIEEEISSPVPVATKPIINEDLTDWMHFWRAAIIIINCIAAAIGISLVYSRWVTKILTRLRPPSVDFLQISQLIVVRGHEPPKGGGSGQGEGVDGYDNGPSTSQDEKGKKKRKRKNDQKKMRKKSEKEETADEEQEE